MMFFACMYEKKSYLLQKRRLVGCRFACYDAFLFSYCLVGSLP